MIEPWFRVLDGAPMLLLTKARSDGVAEAWNEWIRPKIPGLLRDHVGERGSVSAAKPQPPTVVFGAGGVDHRLIRKLRRDGLPFLSYRLSNDGLWPGSVLAKREMELWPGHHESVQTAEREVNTTCGPQREVLCILRNGLQMTVISSHPELDLLRIAARMAFEFTASRFLDRLQKSLSIVRSDIPQPRAGEAAKMKTDMGIDAFVGSTVLVLTRAEAMMEQILREKLSRPIESAMALRDILRTRVDLLPMRGVNILKVLVYTKGDASEKTAVAHLCTQLTTTQTYFPGTNLQLVYEAVPP